MLERFLIAFRIRERTEKSGQKFQWPEIMDYTSRPLPLHEHLQPSSRNRSPVKNFLLGERICLASIGFHTHPQEQGLMIGNLSEPNTRKGKGQVKIESSPRYDAMFL